MTYKVYYVVSEGEISYVFLPEYCRQAICRKIRVDVAKILRGYAHIKK